MIVQKLNASSYAGIEGADKIGMPVDTCAAQLARMAAVEISLVQIMAGRMTGTPEWKVKAAMGRWMWEAATRYADLEKRLTELRSNKSQVAKVLDYQLGDFFKELIQTPDSLTLCVGLFDILLPDYVSSIRQYMEETQPLADQPSVRLLRSHLAEIEENFALGKSFLNDLGEGRKSDSEEWRNHLGAFLSAAGGVSGPAKEVSPLKSRAAEEFRMAREFARDASFKTSIPKRIPVQFQGKDIETMMWLRSQEMTAAEMLASVIFEWEDLPAQGIVDMARHCWDEVRHSLFGCAALEKEGHSLAKFENWIGYAHHTLSVPPQKRYSHLAIATEAGAMAYPGGKRGEWEFCREKAKHPLMTTFQDFDWADEVTHVGYGRRWLIDYYCKGNREMARKMADETVQEREAFYRQYETAGTHNGRAFAGTY